MKKKIYFIRLAWLAIFSMGIRGCGNDATQFPEKQFSKIVFLSNRDSAKRQFDIFMMAPDGQAQTNVTRELSSIRTHSRPVLSPTQAHIVFTAFGTKGPALQIMQLPDLSVMTLTPLMHDVPQVAFSPGGDKLVYVNKVNNLRQIHIINMDGTNDRNISLNDCDEFNPSFSPDGSRIVFVSRGNGRHRICVIHLADLKRALIFEDEGVPANPVFSPQADYIAFSSNRKGNSDIFLIKKNGKGLKNLMHQQSHDIRPQFLPDGSGLIFLSNLRGLKNQDICVIDKLGKQLRILTKALNHIIQNPEITPDGKNIIFELMKFDGAEIYSVNIQTEQLTNLSNHPAWDQSPDI